MSATPTSILARLDELRKWQEQQQQRLMQQHEDKLRESRNNSGYSTIEGLSLFDSTVEEPDNRRHATDADEAKVQRTLAHLQLGEYSAGGDASNVQKIPIVAEQNRFFNRDQGRNGRGESEVEKHLGIRRKQAFLRRGEGLARYRMAPGEQYKPFGRRNQPVREKPAPTQPPNRRKAPLKRRKAQGEKPSLKKIPTEKPSAQKPPKTDEQLQITPLRIPDVTVQPKATWDTVPAHHPPLPPIVEQINRFAAEQDAFNSTQQSQKELLLFESLERKVANSSFSSVNSSAICVQLSSTPHRRLVFGGNADSSDASESDVELPANVQQDYLNLIRRALKLRNCLEQSCESLGVEEEEERDEVTEEESEEGNDETVDLEGTLQEPVRKIKIVCDRDTNTEPWEDRDSEKLFRQRVEQVEMELVAIRRQNNELNRMQSDVERQRRDLTAERQRLHAEIEEERVRNCATIAEERKQMQKERVAFERCMKENDDRPSKKQRQEIAALRTQLANVEETLKLKETKNGMTQARLRNQIKSLEKENAALKDEIDKLNRENAKLQAKEKLTKGAETKILHEINRNVARLSKDKENNEREEGGGGRGKARVRRKVTKVADEESEEESDDSLTSFKLSFPASGVEMGAVPQKVDEIRCTDWTERTLTDGSRQIAYKNGNVKVTSPNGKHVTLKYFNGDVKETDLSAGTIKYFYAQQDTWHTTWHDGTELLEYSNGQREKKTKDGTCTVTYPDGVVRAIFKDGTEKLDYPNGTVVSIDGAGVKTLLLPNGQREVHTAEHKRREYPDGTVKILYPDGLQETRYAGGRIRLKDKQGRLLMDSLDNG